MDREAPAGVVGPVPLSDALSRYWVVAVVGVPDWCTFGRVNPVTRREAARLSCWRAKAMAGLLLGAQVAIAQTGPVVGWGFNGAGAASPPLGDFIQVTGGTYHSVGIRADGTAVTWGDMLQQPPSGTFLYVEACDDIQQFDVGIRSDGTLVSWGAPVTGALNLPAGVFGRIAIGGHHGIGLRTDGSLVGWGGDTFGQATPPPGRFLEVAASQNFSFGIREDHSLSAWGLNESGVLTVPSGSFTSVCAGSHFGLALRTDGTLAAWGSNQFGALNVPPGIFTRIAAGGSTGYAMRPDGTLAGWGYNQSGQANVPAGAFGAIGVGETHAMAIVPTPSSASLVALSSVVACGRRRRFCRFTSAESQYPHSKAPAAPR